MPILALSAAGRLRATASCVALAALAAGCAPVPAPRPSAPPEALTPLPPLPLGEATRFRVSSERSEVRILVFRGGPLARYGHSHVILAGQVEGQVYVGKSLRDSGLRLVLPVAHLIVDPPHARAEEGPEFATQPSPQAVEATQANMLGPATLDRDRFPEITVRSVQITGTDSAALATVRVTLHGVSEDVTAPITVERDGARLTVTGALEIRLTDFGITPFSVLGGGLQVQDLIKVRFRIVATRS